MIGNIFDRIDDITTNNRVPDKEHHKVPRDLVFGSVALAFMEFEQRFAYSCFTDRKSEQKAVQHKEANQMN